MPVLALLVTQVLDNALGDDEVIEEDEVIDEVIDGSYSEASRWPILMNVLVCCQMPETALPSPRHLQHPRRLLNNAKAGVWGSACVVFFWVRGVSGGGVRGVRNEGWLLKGVRAGSLC